jgi:hypothetical protein
MSLEEINYSNVNDQLREMVRGFLNNHPSLTLNAFAQRSGVAPTTLRRLMQDESRSEIAPHSVLALVSYVLREKKISKLIKVVDGPVGDLLRKSFDQFIFDESASDHKLDSDLNEVFKDKLNYLIYKMAANQCGTTFEEIRNNFGLHGVRKLEILMQQKWIVSDRAQVLHAKEKNFTVDLNRAHELTHALVDQYKPSDVEKGYSLFYSLSEGLNEVGVKEVKKIQIEAIKKVFEVMNNKEFNGSIPYFSIFLSDVIGLTPSEELKREVLQ